MPLQLVDETTGENTPLTEVPFDEATLFGADKKLTLEAETIAVFLNELDYDALFEDADVKPYIRSEYLYLKENSDGSVSLCEAKDDDALELPVESIDGAIAAEFIDEDDLMKLFEHFVTHELGEETLEDRTIKALFAESINYEQLDEKSPFKRGDFRKGPMKHVSAASKGGGRQAHNQRVRMMMAMMKKGDIKRVKKGHGYKGGDWKYGRDKNANPGMYAAMRRKLRQRAGSIRKLPVDPGRKKIINVIYKNLGAAMPSHWIPPERRGGKKLGGKATVKKVAVKTGSKKAAAKAASKNIFAKRLAASHDVKSTVMEGAGLAAVAMGRAPVQKRMFG